MAFVGPSYLWYNRRDMDTIDGRDKGLSELTDRELEILERVATGATNQQVAVELDISINTVKAHLRNVYAKLGVESRTEATLCAIQCGLIHIDEREERDEPTPEGDTPEVLPPSPPLVGVSWPLSPVQAIVVGLVLVFFVAISVWPAARTGAADAQTRLMDSAAAPAAEVALVNPSRWRALAQMPSPRSRFAAATLDGTVYVIGGIGRDGVSAQVMAYDPVDDRWAYRASKPSPVANIGAAVLNGRIYVPGGLAEDGELLATVEVYDPLTDTWEQGPPLPQALCAYALAADDHGIYLVGGWDGRRYLDTVYYLDAEEQVWRERTPLPSARGFAAAAVAQERLYVVGGYDGEQDLALVQSLPLDADQESVWMTHAPMALRRAGHGMALSQSSLYVVGGGWESGFGFNERYDVANDAWSSFDSPLVGEWRNLSLALAEARGGAFVLAMGGWNGRHLGIVEGYQVFFPIYLSTIEIGR